MKNSVFVLLLGLMLSAATFAQDNTAAPLYPDTAHPTQAPAREQDSAPQQMNQNTGQNDPQPASQGTDQNDQMPVFRVNVYARTTRAVNYRHRGGSTIVDLRGTELMPEVGGKAKVDGKAGRLAINVELTHMRQASSFGGQYLTYVLWAITPEGRAVNLGEVLPGDNGKDKIDVTTDLQAFGLIVTAEPYYASPTPATKWWRRIFCARKPKVSKSLSTPSLMFWKASSTRLMYPPNSFPPRKPMPGCRWICWKPATQ